MQAEETKLIFDIIKHRSRLVFMPTPHTRTKTIQYNIGKGGDVKDSKLEGMDKIKKIYERIMTNHTLHIAHEYNDAD
jgi:hypothetical protein